MAASDPESTAVPPDDSLARAAEDEAAAAEARAEEALIRSPIALPPLNLVQRLALIPEYSTLVTAVTVAKLAGALSGPG